MSRHDEREFWCHAFSSSALPALQLWGAEFGAATEEGRFLHCRALLRAAKSLTLEPAQRGVICYAEAKLLDREGETERAIQAYERGQRELHQAGIHQLDQEISRQIGALRQELGQLDAAALDLKQAMPKEAEASRERGMTLINLGNLSLERGRLDEAEACFTEAVQLLDLTEDRYNATAARVGVGHVRSRQARYEEALAIFVQATTQFQEVGSERGVLQVAGNISVLHRRAGRLDAARSQLELALPRVRELGDEGLLYAFLADLGGVAQDLGDRAAARTHLTQALQGLRDNRDHARVAAVRQRLEVLDDEEAVEGGERGRRDRGGVHQK